MSIATAEPTGRVVVIDRDRAGAVTVINREDVVRARVSHDMGCALFEYALRAAPASLQYIQLGNDNADAARVLASVVDEDTDIVWTVERGGVTRVPDVAR